MFLVVESDATADACRYVVVIMSTIQGTLHESEPTTTDWSALNEEMRAATREFLAAARQELEVGNERSASPHA